MQAIIDETYQRIRRLWSFVLISPILYLFLARAMVALDWVETFPQARHPWDSGVARWSLGTVAAVVLATVGWLRWRRPRVVRMLADDAARALRRWVWYFYAMATLSDSITFLSLVYFILSGHIWAILIGGAGTYLGYALTYPMQQDLADLKEKE